MNPEEGNSRRSLSAYLAGKAIQMKLPLNGTFELSPVCNFSCRMCYVRKTEAEVRQHTRRSMTLADWRRAAREAREAGTLYLLLTGGEPLLWPDFWTLYEELIDMGFLVSVNTNGSLIDSEAVARFKKRPPERLNITLYGASSETYRRLCGVDGVFERVDSAIRALCENHIHIRINCSLTPENVCDLDWIVDYAKECGVPLAAATYMFPPIRRAPEKIGENERFSPEDCARYRMRYLERDRGEEAYRRYLHGIVNGCIEPPGLDEGCIDPVDGKIRCRAGRSSFWITWDGWMTPCGMMPEPKTDLTVQSLSAAWKALTVLAGEVRLSGVCDACPNLKICHPCAAIAYAETGKASGIPTYMCRAAQEMRRIACETLHEEINNA